MCSNEFTQIVQRPIKTANATEGEVQMRRDYEKVNYIMHFDFSCFIYF